MHNVRYYKNWSMGQDPLMPCDTHYDDGKSEGVITLCNDNFANSYKKINDDVLLFMSQYPENSKRFVSLTRRQGSVKMDFKFKKTLSSLAHCLPKLVIKFYCLFSS